MNEQVSKLVHNTVASVQKQYGKESLMFLGDCPGMNIKTFSSGSLQLDYALGGGIPKGRIIEVFGPESSGKTTLTLHMIAEIQKQGGAAAFIDAEHALDPIYAENIGVNIDELCICQPDDGEQALSVVESILNGGGFNIIVIDSVAALVPKAELDGEMGAANIGLQARLMSKALRKFTAIAASTECTIVFINQLREKVGVMYGNPETTTGGRALKFYASVRIDVRKKETLKEGTEAIANHVIAKVVKNKIAPPFRQAEFDIVFGEGISKKSEIAKLAVDFDIIHKTGGWYTYEDLKVQGIEAVKEALYEDENFMNEVVNQIKQKLGGEIDKTLSEEVLENEENNENFE